MPTIVDGLYVVKLFQVADTEEMLNVFWYIDLAFSNTKSLQLATLFNANVLPDISNIQHTAITYTNLQVQAIFGTAIEVNFNPSPSNGSVAGTRMNNAYSASIRLNRGTTETRSGWKRFSGLVEENVNTNSFTGPYLNLLDTLAQQLRANLDDGANIFQPVIIRRPGTAGNPPNTNYIFNQMSGATAVDRPTTQNSRKAFS